jgi:isocitrate/isopropylmalate dehydrogenase
VIRKGTPQELATEVSINTAFGVERVVRAAFDRARSRPRRHLTLVHKNNVLVYAGDLWVRTVQKVAAEYPEVATAYHHVDATTIYLVTDPGRYDVIVTDNLFGDIITDLAAAISGGIGLAASGNVDPSHRNPSMFEPVHGSAPDIAGQGIADPRLRCSPFLCCSITSARQRQRLGSRQQLPRTWPRAIRERRVARRRLVSGWPRRRRPDASVTRCVGDR